MDKVESKKKIQQLVEDYWNKKGTHNAYTEQDTATKWIKPLLEYLGWNLYDLKEVKEGVKIDLRSGEQRFFDCVLYHQIDFDRLNEHIVMEFKKLGAGFLQNKLATIEKLVGNAKETSAKYAVLTRFDETIIYDAKTGEQKVYFRSPDDYVSKFEALWSYLANPKVIHG
jgi:hypothetical protein